MSDNPWDNPQLREWMDHVARNVAPMVRRSGFTISLMPDNPKDTDIKFAVELGLTICYDKPLIVVVTPGVHVPDHLARCADEVVEWDGVGDPHANQRLVDAIQRVHDATT